MKSSLSFFFIYCFLLLTIIVVPANTINPTINSDEYNITSILSTLTPAELIWLDKKQAIAYVYDPNWAPFEWKNDVGQHTGIITDIMYLIKHKTGINFVAASTDTWAESVKLMKDTKFDMYSAITINEEREKYLTFTSKDIYSYPAVLVTKFYDKTVYLDIKKDFKNKKIGVVKSSGLGLYIKKNNPELDFIEVSSTQEGFTFLENNKIDLFAINTVTAKYYIEKKGFSNLKIALKLDYIYHLKIAVNKHLPQEIISILDKALSSISEEEFNKIFTKWTEVAIEKQTDWMLVIKIISILMIIFLFFLWNTRRLKLLVKERTIELRSLNQQLEKMAHSDALTGLHNRRQLINDFERELKRVIRFDRKMAIFYMDLNRFKAINDELGHEVGDTVLQHISQKVSSSLRENEVMYRLGGDEFCILVPEFNDKEQLIKLADRIIRDITSINHFGGSKIEIGCSLGIAIYPDDGETLSDLTSAADRAMYVIKASHENNFGFVD